jgi:hypothetical protein
MIKTLLKFAGDSMGLEQIYIDTQSYIYATNGHMIVRFKLPIVVDDPVSFHKDDMHPGVIVVYDHQICFDGYAVSSTKHQHLPWDRCFVKQKCHGNPQFDPKLLAIVNSCGSFDSLTIGGDTEPLIAVRGNMTIALMPLKNN